MAEPGESGIGKTGAHAPSADGTHSGGAQEGGATCETHDGCLELVVCVVSEGEERHARAYDCVEEEVVAGIACGALDGTGGRDGGEWGDTPGDVCGVMGYAEDVGICSCGCGHVGRSGLEVVHDMDGEEGAGREELAEEEEETGGVGAG